MRKLTIQRQKSFVGCMATMEVYLEDPAGALEIFGYKATKLGYLPNGATTSFDIPEGEWRVFVIAGKMSKSFCGDFCQIPAEGDVFLTGKNHFNPGSGNSYLFDNNNCAEASSYRGKGKKIGWIIMICSIILGIAVGIAVGVISASVRNNAPKTFKEPDFSITLTSGFKQQNLNTFLASFRSAKIDLTVSRETIPDSVAASVSDYAELIRKYNPDRSMTLFTEKNVTFLEYTYTVEATGQTFASVRAMFRNGAYIYTFNFICTEADYPSLRPEILAYAQSVVFS